jgi:hypothetical protein
MTKEEIIEMAEKAGFMFTEHGSPIGFTHSMLEDFANLVSEKESEKCLERATIALLGTLTTTRDRVLNAIRARGQE